MSSTSATPTPSCPGLHFLRAPQLFEIFWNANRTTSTMTFEELEPVAQELFRTIAFNTMDNAHKIVQTGTKVVIARAATQLGIDMLGSELGHWTVGLVDGANAMVQSSSSTEICDNRTLNIAALGVKTFMAINQTTQHRGIESIKNMMQLTRNSLHIAGNDDELFMSAFDFCADVFGRFRRDLYQMDQAESRYFGESLWVACDGSKSEDELKALCL